MFLMYWRMSRPNEVFGEVVEVSEGESSAESSRVRSMGAEGRIGDVEGI